jgi:WD40 repeat protein
MYNTSKNSLILKFAFDMPLLDCIYDKTFYNNIFCAGLDGSLSELKLERKATNILGSHNLAINKLLFHEQHKFIISSGLDCKLKFWDLTSQKEVGMTTYNNLFPSNIISLNENTIILAGNIIGTNEGIVYLVDIRYVAYF